MKLSPILCASVVALAAFVLTPVGAFASVNYNSSKSNTGNRTAPNNSKNGKGDKSKGGVAGMTSHDGSKGYGVADPKNSKGDNGGTQGEKQGR